LEQEAELGLGSLAAFIFAMWLLVLGLVAFLVVFVAPLDAILDRANFSRLEISIVQAVVAVIVVLAVILALSRMKRLYLRLKLRN
jgi:hypothetical protein